MPVAHSVPRAEKVARRECNFVDAEKALLVICQRRREGHRGETGEGATKAVTSVIDNTPDSKLRARCIGKLWLVNTFQIRECGHFRASCGGNRSCHGQSTISFDTGTEARVLVGYE